MSNKTATIVDKKSHHGFVIGERVELLREVIRGGQHGFVCQSIQYDENIEWDVLDSDLDIDE